MTRYHICDRCGKTVPGLDALPPGWRHRDKKVPAFEKGRYYNTIETVCTECLKKVEAADER